MGVCIRDEEGKVIASMAGKEKACPIPEFAKAMAILKGLQPVKELECKYIGGRCCCNPKGDREGYRDAVKLWASGGGRNLP